MTLRDIKTVKMQHPKPHCNGFSLIELLVVLTVASVCWPSRFFILRVTENYTDRTIRLCLLPTHCRRQGSARSHSGKPSA
ncbi:MAG: prepilin-type N-terminal cleavage/methylation domain-containing protein [Acidobacteriota bacterium]